MNWEAIGAVGEVAGALGVIITLIYLSSQVRTGNLASKVEAKLSSTQMYTGFLGQLIASPEINDVFNRGRNDLSSLNTEEYFRYSNLAFQSFSFFSAGYFQYSCRTLSDSDWFDWLAIIRFWLRGKGCQQWWETRGKFMYGPDFVAFIESERHKIAATAESNTAQTQQ